MALLPLTPFKKAARTDLVAVEIGEDLLKVAHVKLTQLRREVQHLISHEIRGLDEDAVAALLRKTLVGFGASAAPAFLTVPLQVVITRTIEIPSRDPDEIREIVNLQASRHTPYSRSEIIIDMALLGVVRESYTKVLLVIVPKEIVLKHARILEKVPMPLERVVFAPEGVGLACSKILNIEHSDAVVGIVHVDASYTTFTVVQKGKLLFVRGISIGAVNLLEEKELYADRFVDELQKSLDSFVTDEAGPPPTQVLLTGVAAETHDLDDLFTETLRVPVRNQTYFNHFAISTDARQTAEANSKRLSFFNLVAPLLLYDKLKLDLTPEERKLKIELERRGRQIGVTAVLVLVLLSLLFGLLVSKIAFRRIYLERLSSRYKNASVEAKDLEQGYRKAIRVREFLAARGEPIEAFSEFYDTLPDNVRLSEIKYENSVKLSVKGTSSAMSAVFGFVGSLEKSPRFKNVKTKYVTTRSEEGVDVADFEISCALERPRGLAG